MSQYVNFYAHKNDVFISLAEYSRNNLMYKALEYDAPYEKGCVLTKEILSKAIEWFDIEIHAYESRIERLTKENELIAKLSDPMEEKLDRFNENLDYIKDCENVIEELKAQKAELHFMFNIEAEIWIGIEYNPNFDEEEE